MALSLKNKFSIITVLIVFALFLVNCDNTAKKEEAETAKADSIANCAKPVNPNGDSELAMLMREMMHSAGNLREMVKQGTLPAKFPEEFLKIHTAQPTPIRTAHTNSSLMRSPVESTMCGRPAESMY